MAIRKSNENDDLTAAIIRGITEGNAPLSALLVSQNDKNHSLANLVQQNIDKTHDLDGEVRLLKGVIVSLVGASGDGSSGLIPRMEKDMKEVKEDVGTLKSDLREVRGNVNQMMSDVSAIRASQVIQTVKDAKAEGGMVVSFKLIGWFISLIIGLAAALVWLFQHGVKP